MPAYNVFFFGCLFFILGILVYSWGFKTAVLTLVAFIFLIGAVLYLIFKNKVFIQFALLSLLILAGLFYTSFFNLRLKEKANFLLNGGEDIYNGLIYKILPNERENKIIVKNKEFNLLLAFNFPLLLREGEEIYFDIKNSKIREAPSYLLKDGVVLEIKNPKILAVKESNSFLGKLLLFKNKIVDYFKKVFPKKEAAFISGLLVGEREDFSPDFSEAMKKSGTSHLVALSGYNISIIVAASLTFFLYFFPRKIALIFTFFLIFLFVFMTGAESSVVRAAFLGILGILAKEEGRLYDPRNVIIFSALLMLLFNPNLIMWDVGFKLSFLAFLGLVYLKPLLFFKGESNENYSGDNDFKENIYDIIYTTLSAQIMVFPVLISNFGYVSLVGALSNVFLLGLIPLTMFLGFLNLIASFVSKYLVLISGWILFAFLKVEIIIIEFFGRLNLTWNFNGSWIVNVLYYCALFLFVLWRKKYLKLL